MDDDGDTRPGKRQRKEDYSGAHVHNVPASLLEIYCVKSNYAGGKKQREDY